MALAAHPVPLPGPTLDAPATLAAIHGGTAEFLTPRPALTRRIPAAGLVATIDVLIVVAGFVAMIVGINIDHMPDGLDAFLALR